MPQMMPLNWLTLFILFISTYMFYIIINYYIYMPILKSLNIKFNKLNSKFNWKW